MSLNTRGRSVAAYPLWARAELLLSGMSNPPPRMAMNAAQHKIINLLKTFFVFAHQFTLVFVYLMCGPKQLFFCQCGPEMPEGWTPLLRSFSFCAEILYLGHGKSASLE